MSISEPDKITTPWASTGSKNPIPANANNTTGSAGFDKGFPDITMTPEEAGGLPPAGQDFNGILYQITDIIRYIQAGGGPTFSADMAAAIGGYLNGSIVAGNNPLIAYKNMISGNSSNPNAGGLGWYKDYAKQTFNSVQEMLSDAKIFHPGIIVFWLGYHEISDGGGNWGTVKSGSHVEDGGSVFSLGPNLYIEANLKGKRVSLKKFGCVQDGATNDKTQFYNAVDFATNNNLILDCAGLPTLVSDSSEKIFISTSPVRLHDLNIIPGLTYLDQPRLKFDSDVDYEIINLKVRGGRGSKSGLEPWRKFTAFLGYDSIEPTTGNLITIGGSLLTSNITIHGVDAKDCHYENVLLGHTSGVADIKQLQFENCSNKQLHILHGVDGVSQPITGVTNLNGYVARNCGILPASFTVDGIAKTRSDPVSPQGAFGCIVSYGTFNHSNVFVYNYGSTGVTPDRNITAMGKNIKIWHADPHAFSNNSSGAYWDEYCGNCEVDGLEIKISARDPRETPLENCALQIFKQTSGIFSATNVAIETSGIASIDKDIRGSLSAGAQVSINGYSLESNASNTSISMLQTSGLSSKIELRGGRVRGAPMRITQSQNLFIDGLDSNQNLTINQSLPSAIGDVTLTDVNCAALAVDGSSGEVQINGGSASGFTSGGVNGSLRLDGGFTINGLSEVTGYKSLVVGDIETSRRFNVLDVKRMKSVGSIFKTDQPEACLRVAPSAPGVMQQATLIGVSCWVKTGTSGAGYTAIGDVGNLTELSPDNQTFAWE